MAEEIPQIDKLICEACMKYQEEFKEKPTHCGYAPGRVNLIGEHTDYNDGFVFPMALPLVTVVVGSPISGTKSTLVTTSAKAENPKRVVIDMENVVKASPHWANYARGVIANHPAKPPAFNAVIHASVPYGGGVSSSASYEVSILMFLDSITNAYNLNNLKDKALLCQKAEHEYAGVPCGIMDQFVALMAEEDNALLIDCKMLTSELIPFNDPNVVVLITNSNVVHHLEGSEYPTRRRQCEKAAELLGVKKLREVCLNGVERLKAMKAELDVVKRARHVITEIKRCQEAAGALKEKNFELFGKLMVESHNSLRDDFEVSIPELDALVCMAMSVEGVYGSRMTGGGFGGCTVTLLKDEAVSNVIETINKHYTGTPAFYVCKPSGPAKIVALPG